MLNKVDKHDITVVEFMSLHEKAKGNRLNSSTANRTYLFLPGNGPLKSTLSLSHGCIALTRVSTGFQKKRGFISAQIWQFEYTLLTSSTENGKFLVFTKCDN